MEYKEEYPTWVRGDGEPRLFVFEALEPIRFPLIFFSSLLSRDTGRILTKEETEEALRYFSTKPRDFFGLAVATPRDTTLLWDLAATLGALEPSSGRREALVAKPYTMTLVVGQ